LFLFQVIKWMQQPTELSALRDFQDWKETCDEKGLPYCSLPNACPLTTRELPGETLRLFTCMECPNNYPWLLDPTGDGFSARKWSIICETSDAPMRRPVARSGYQRSNVFPTNPEITSDVVVIDHGASRNEGAALKDTEKAIERQARDFGRDLGIILSRLESVILAAWRSSRNTNKLKWSEAPLLSQGETHRARFLFLDATIIIIIIYVN